STAGAGANTLRSLSLPRNDGAGPLPSKAPGRFHTLPNYNYTRMASGVSLGDAHRLAYKTLHSLFTNSPCALRRRCYCKLHDPAPPRFMLDSCANPYTILLPQLDFSDGAFGGIQCTVYPRRQS